MANTDYYSRPYELVRGQIDTMSSRADSSLASARDSINDLKNIELPTESPLPSAPDLSLAGIDFAVVDAPQPVNFGDVDDFRAPSVESVDISSLTTDTIPTFTPSIGSITLPPAPGPIDTSGKPTRPELTDIIVPDAPILPLPELGNLAEITIPEFVFPELPTFDGQAPTKDFTAPNTLLQWAEPVYESLNLDAIRARVGQLLQGGTGIPAVIEQALFDRARAREDIAALKAKQEAFDTFAARGFSMPPGMLVAQTNAIIEDNQLKTNAINRDILSQAAQWEIENLRFAVQQGIAVESVLIQSFQQMAQRAFEAARYRVEAEISLYNANVGLFNAEQNAYSIAASVYKTRLDGSLAELEVFKAQIEGERVKGQVNEQIVRAFQARTDALRSQVEVYKVTMDGVQAQSELNRNQIEAYKADISAYAEGLQAQKTEFESFEALVRAESAKSQIIDAEARAFAATVQAYESNANIKVRNLSAKIEAMQASTARFSARAQAERDRVAAQASAVQAKAQAYSADIGRYSAELNASTSRAELGSRIIDSRLRNNLAFYEVNIREYDQKQQRAITTAQLQSEAIKSAGQMAAQLAAGAMSAMHVSASMSGSAGVSSSESFSTVSNLS